VSKLTPAYESSVDNYHLSYRLSIAGGITTALILPGSANAIAGEAYSIKLRSTYEHTPSSMLVDAPPQLNGTRAPLRWRHMKYEASLDHGRQF
jgi:hypothetical protein